MFRKGLVLSLVGVGAVLALGLGCQPSQPVPLGTPQTAQKGAAAAPTKVAEKASEKPVRGGTVRLSSGFERSLDPQVEVTYELNTSIYDPLIEPDKDGNLTKEGLAKDWAIGSDGKSITFKLREGVKFQDGTDFDAASVKFGIERMKDPASKSGFRTLYDNVASVEVVNSLTVRFNLTKPDALLLSVSTYQSGMVVSPAAVKKWGQDFGRHPVGTGPFQFVEWVQGDHITLKRFEGYWKKDKDGNQLPYLDGAVYPIITDPTTAVANFRTGAVDIMSNIPPGSLQSIKSDPNLAYGTQRRFSQSGVAMNTRRPPFDNKALRQAVALAIDRQGTAAVQGVPGAEAFVATSVLNPLSWGYDAKVGVFPDQDLAKAKAKMAEAGYPAGGLKVKIPTDSQRARAAETLQANLAQIGIDGEIETLASAIYIARVLVPSPEGKVDYQIAAANLVGPGMADPGYVLAMTFHGKGVRNFFGPWDNPQVTELMDKAGRIFDQKERASLYQEAAKIIAEEMPFIPTYIPVNIGGWNKKVQNYVPYPDNFARVHQVWLAK